MRLHLLLSGTGVVQKSSRDSRDEPVQKIVIDSRKVPMEKVVRVTFLARRKRENVKRVLKSLQMKNETQSNRLRGTAKSAFIASRSKSLQAFGQAGGGASGVGRGLTHAMPTRFQELSETTVEFPSDARKVLSSKTGKQFPTKTGIKGTSRLGRPPPRGGRGY